MTSGAVFLALLALAAASPGPGPAPRAPAASTAAPAAPAAPGSWPRTVSEGELSFEVHAPQPRSLADGRIAFRVVVVAREAGGPARLGEVSLEARAGTPDANGMFRATEPVVTRVRFPAAQEREAAWGEALRRLFPPGWTFTRAYVDASLAAAAGAAQAGAPRNDPPVILFRTGPAVLVYVDGEPTWRALPETRLERILNTRPLVLRDPASGRVFLRLYDGWLGAASLAGPWAHETAPGPELDRALAWAKGRPELDLLDGADDEDPQAKAPSLADGPAPEVIVATRPTELVVTEGPPRATEIEGTSLRAWTNTDATVLEQGGTRFVLLAGRFFRSTGPSDPWTFVPADQLPADFARIPPGHEQAGAARAAVAGTPEAEEARLASELPSVVEVPRADAAFRPGLDGEPRLEPIESTQLQRVVNASEPVIRYSESSWYGVGGGVWYVAPAPSGPWVVADSVPPEIYAIPVSSPVHHVTYVRVYGATPTVVRVLYTPGYSGAEIAPGGVVVYGSGYAHRPWIGSAWYGPPVTYGFGFRVVFAPYTGWYLAPGYGVRPWWGPPVYRPRPVYSPRPVYGPVYRPPRPVRPGYAPAPSRPGYRPQPGYRPPTVSRPSAGGRPPGAVRPPGAHPNPGRPGGPGLPATRSSPGGSRVPAAAPARPSQGASRAPAAAPARGARGPGIEREPRDTGR